MECRACSRIQARSQRHSLCRGWVAGGGDTDGASHRSFTVFWSKTI